MGDQCEREHVIDAGENQRKMHHILYILYPFLPHLLSFLHLILSSLTEGG